MTTGPALAKLEAISCSYGTRRVVDQVSLELRPGEVFGLLGPNGSGKSTLLKVLVGLLVPDCGKVTIDGLDLSCAPRAARARIGYVPEDISPYPGMRVREFLAFMGGLKGLSGARIRQETERVGELLSLGGEMYQLLGNLSHGYRQRVLIAQALLGQPPLLVLDEPTNGIDPAQLRELRELVLSLVPYHAVLLASHLLAEVERVADRVGIMLRGRMLSVLPIARQCHAVRMRLEAPRELAVGTWLAAQPEVIEAWPVQPLPGERIHLSVADAKAAERIARALQAAGCVVLEFGPAAGTLEETFLELVGGATP